jgi:hypothetical protein
LFLFEFFLKSKMHSNNTSYLSSYNKTYAQCNSSIPIGRHFHFWHPSSIHLCLLFKLWVFKILCFSLHFIVPLVMQKNVHIHLTIGCILKEFSHKFSQMKDVCLYLATCHIFCEKHKIFNMFFITPRNRNNIITNVWEHKC